MVIIGSVREGRVADKVTNWALKQMEQEDIELDVVDLKDIKLPFYYEPTLPVIANGQYDNLEATAWAKRVAEADAFIMITPEYNHGYPASLKNAIDWVAQGWYHKPIGFISYGGISGGIRAVQQLKQVVLEVRMHPVHDNVYIPFVSQAFDESGNPTSDNLNNNLKSLVNEIQGLESKLRS